MKRIQKNLISLLLVVSMIATLGMTGFASASAAGGMRVGVGKADITGPITDISTGYNSLGDLMEGLLMRLYARAFIIESNGQPVVYATAELVHMTESIKPGVLKELARRGLSQYTAENVMLSATHCHSSTSNVSWYALYDLINGVPGYDDESYNLIVQGIADAIQRAHEDLAPGSVSLAYADTGIGNYNRSLNAVKWNVNFDASRYASDYDAAVNTVSKEMSVLRFRHDGEGDIGLLSFFPSHGTSNSIDNTLVAADHKGYAAWCVEEQMGGDYVAAFPQNESGDASPNRPHQEDVTDAFQRPTDLDSSLDPIENEIVQGQEEADAALHILKGGSGVTTINLSNKVAWDYTTVDFSDIAVDKKYIGDYHMPYDDVDHARTSEPCIGAGIIAGDEEGAPVDNAAEGSVRHDYRLNPETGEVEITKCDFSMIDLYGLQNLFEPLWPYAMALLQSDGYDDEQMEKVVCLAVGNLMQKAQPLQVFRIGELAITGCAFELSTEQGRRIRAVLEETLRPLGVRKVINSTHTNAYSQYMSTREEYAAQHYEGATTLFGPWSGAAMTQELDKLCQNIVAGRHSAAGPALNETGPAALVISTPAAAIPAAADTGDPGSLITDVEKDSFVNGETVTAVFGGANPRHITDMRLAGKLTEDYTYLEVQKLVNGNWTTVRTDSDPYTYISVRSPSLGQPLQASVNWLLRNVEPGTYRLVYNGYSKDLLGNYNGFTSESKPFLVNQSGNRGLPFVDVKEADWSWPYVKYVYENGMFAGTSATTFEPNTAMTRGMFVTVLWAKDGKPSAGESSFKDLRADWYKEAVAWAAANRIVGGYSNDSFGPEDPITREQMAAIMLQYAKYKGLDTAPSGILLGYGDVLEISSYAVTAMKWAVGHKILAGTNRGLEPKSAATRAQVAVVLKAFSENF